MLLPQASCLSAAVGHGWPNVAIHHHVRANNKESMYPKTLQLYFSSEGRGPSADWMLDLKYPGSYRGSSSRRALNTPPAPAPMSATAPPMAV